MSAIFSTKAFRDFIFWMGAVRKLQTFPWVTWDQHKPLVTHEDIDSKIIPLLEPGDVGVHKNFGFLSNLFIPGMFKHTWLHVDNGPTPQIIEATADGVEQHSARYPLRSDLVAIVRPKLPLEARLDAVARAKKIVGMRYDVAFDFDLPQEFEHLDVHHQAFSCIEVIAYAYYPYFDQLGFKWQEHLGKQVLYPETVVNDNWDVIYTSIPLN